MNKLLQTGFFALKVTLIVLMALSNLGLSQVVQLAPQAEQGHSALGAVLVNRGHVKEGIRELDKALAIKSTDSIAQMNLA